MDCTEAYREHIMYSRPCRYDTAGSHTAATLPGAYFSGIGNQITPTPGIKRRHGHLPHPFRIRRTLLSCRQSGEGVHNSMRQPVIHIPTMPMTTESLSFIHTCFQTAIMLM